MAVLPKVYDLSRTSVGGFTIVAKEEDCGCATVSPTDPVIPDDGGDPTDNDCTGRRKDPDGVIVESFCPDLILVSSGAGDVGFIDGGDITIGTDTVECVDGIHEVTKTLIDLGQYFFQVIEIFTDMNARALDWTICGCVCDIGVDLRQAIEFRFIEAFFTFNSTFQIQVTVQSCKTKFILAFDVIVPPWPIN